MSGAPDFEVIQDAYLDNYNPVTRELDRRPVASAGERVYWFRGTTYGVISPEGRACSLGGTFVNPFFEVAKSNLRPIVDGEQ